MNLSHISTCAYMRINISFSKGGGKMSSFFEISIFRTHSIELVNLSNFVWQIMWFYCKSVLNLKNKANPLENAFYKWQKLLGQPSKPKAVICHINSPSLPSISYRLCYYGGNLKKKIKTNVSDKAGTPCIKRVNQM